VNSAATTAVPETREQPAGFTLRQRLLLWLSGWAGFLLIRLIGPTLRYRVSMEEGGPAVEHQRPAVYCFWHQCVIPACYYFRGRDIAVMTSRSFDGESIARIIEKFGYLPVRGSSSRGGAGALLGMHNLVEFGRAVAFTSDGPRGPRYVAKPGPVVLARNTLSPLLCFHIALERRWLLPSWDAMMVPMPFSRALLRVSRVLRLPPEADAQAVERCHIEMQAALERARQFAEENVARG